MHANEAEQWVALSLALKKGQLEEHNGVTWVPAQGVSLDRPLACYRVHPTMRKIFIVNRPGVSPRVYLHYEEIVGYEQEYVFEFEVPELLLQSYGSTLTPTPEQKEERLAELPSTEQTNKPFCVLADPGISSLQIQKAMQHLEHAQSTINIILGGKDV